MKGITEMTEQEILALTEEDVQKMIKLRMMEEGIKWKIHSYLPPSVHFKVIP